VKSKTWGRIAYEIIANIHEGGIWEEWHSQYESNKLRLSSVLYLKFAELKRYQPAKQATA
jgi:hypothetical protein